VSWPRRSSAEPVAAPATLRVGGLTPFTSIDFPGQLAAVVFVQGCPWRCGYCHNPHLQPRRVPAGAAPDWPQVVEWLGRRLGLIDAVVFSGGEPTMDPGLERALRDARALGLLTGLHTAGMYPRRFERALPHLDWVGFDVKAPLARADLLGRVTGVRTDADAVARSLRALLESGVAHECRTTAHPALLSDEDLVALASDLAARGVRRHVVQVARPAAAARAPLESVAADYPSAATLHTMRSLFADFSVRRG